MSGGDAFPGQTVPALAGAKGASNDPGAPRVVVELQGQGRREADAKLLPPGAERSDTQSRNGSGQHAPKSSSGRSPLSIAVRVYFLFRKHVLMEEIAKDLAPEEAKVKADLVTVRRIAGMAGQEMKLIIPATILSALGTLVGMMTPYLVGKYMDVLTVTQNLDDFRHIFKLMIVFSIWSTLLTFTVGMLFAFAGMQLSQRLRNLVFRRVLHQDMEFFEKRRVGELVSRLGSDSGVIQGLLTNTFITLLNNTFTLVGGLVGAFLTCWKLASFSMIFVPLITFSAAFFGMLMRRFSLIAMDASAKANEIAVESIFYVHVVHMFGQQENECRRYADRIRYNVELSKRAMYIKTAFGSLTGILSTCVNLSLMYYGASLVITRQLSVGSMVSFQMYMGMGLNGYKGFAGFYTGLQSALGGSQRFFELVDRLPSVSHEGGRTIDTQDPCGGKRNHIDFVGVHFAYPRRPDVPVFAGLNMSVPAGETVALVGPSGSGKSTIARLLSRVYDVQSGSVTLHGHDVRELQLDYLRSQIAWVEQEPVLFSRSVHENVAYSRLRGASREDVERVCKLANAHDFIVGFNEGYNTKCGERGVQISGGQKQRLAIARALLKDAPILVLDEATSALDAESEELVRDALEKLLNGRTTIIIAHRLSTIQRADRIVVMAQGRVVEQGTHSELMATAGFYASFVARQMNAQQEEAMKQAVDQAPGAEASTAIPGALGFVQQISAPAEAVARAPVPLSVPLAVQVPGQPAFQTMPWALRQARLVQALRQLPSEEVDKLLAAAGHLPTARPPQRTSPTPTPQGGGAPAAAPPSPFSAESPLEGML